MLARLAGLAANRSKWAAAGKTVQRSVHPMLAQIMRLSTADPNDSRPRDIMVRLCEAANDGNKATVKALAAKLCDDTFLEQVMDDDRELEAYFPQPYLGHSAVVESIGYGKEDIEDLLDQEDDFKGWTPGQKLTNEQWKQISEALFDIVDEGSSKHGADAFLQAFHEDWQPRMLPVIEELLLPEDDKE